MGKFILPFLLEFCCLLLKRVPHWFSPQNMTPESQPHLFPQLLEGHHCWPEMIKLKHWSRGPSVNVSSLYPICGWSAVKLLSQINIFILFTVINYFYFVCFLKSTWTVLLISYESVCIIVNYIIFPDNYIEIHIQ